MAFTQRGMGRSRCEPRGWQALTEAVTEQPPALGAWAGEDAGPAAAELARGPSTPDWQMGFVRNCIVALKGVGRTGACRGHRALRFS